LERRLERTHMGKVVDEALIPVSGHIEENLPSTWGHLVIAVQNYSLGGHEMGIATNMMVKDVIYALRTMADQLEASDASVRLQRQT